MAEWFERWFGEAYLAVYPHRSDEAAANEVEFILGQRRLEDVERVLDTACGNGRHLQALAERGAMAHGIDLSEALLAQASKRSIVRGQVTRADMRQMPFPASTFTLVLSMFTSFGYFATTEENRSVLREVRRVIHDSGIFVLDYLNLEQVTRELVPFSTRQVGGIEIREHRSIRGNNDRIEKQIVITDIENGKSEQYTESVALFSRAQLEALLKEAGFRVQRVLGDFAGTPHSPHSPRCIFFAEAIS